MIHNYVKKIVWSLESHNYIIINIYFDYYGIYHINKEKKTIVTVLEPTNNLDLIKNFIEERNII